LAVVYLAVGVAVQKFVFKEEGVRLIPNSDLWLALPGLVKVLSDLSASTHMRSDVGWVELTLLGRGVGRRMDMCLSSPRPWGCSGGVEDPTRRSNEVKMESTIL
jgi:hypothetical protein